MNLAYLLLLPLTACQGIDSLLDAMSATKGAAPIVRGSNGGSAKMTIVTCPRTQQGIEAARELMQQMIAYNSELVVARSNASAQLTIDACPAGAAQLSAVPAPPRR